MARFFFAWVDPGVPFNPGTHAVMDEDIISAEIIEVEDKAPEMRIVIATPSAKLLDPVRKRWAWFAYEDDALTITTLIKCWLVAVPQGMKAGVAVELNFVATPVDFEAQKAALAATLNADPDYYDPVFVDRKERDNPNSALAARTAFWHIHPTTHVVSINDFLQGEAGNIVLASGDHVPHSSLDVTYSEVPLRLVRFKADVHWTQKAQGNVDLSDMVAQAGGVIKTWTGDGTWTNWPQKGDNIGGDWSFGDSSLVFIGQTFKDVPVQYYQAPIPDEEVDPEAEGPTIDKPTTFATVSITLTPPKVARFYEWTLKPKLVVHYETERQRSETLLFRLTADVQDIMAAPGSLNRLELSASAPNLAEKVDVGGAMPIGDLRNSQYFTTERGRRSIEYLLRIARKHIALRARMVQIMFRVPFETALGVTLKHTITLTDSRLSGGQATGKVVSKTLTIDPRAGGFGTIIIACSVGKGNTASTNLGTPTIAQLNALDASVQVLIGATYTVGDIVYPDISGIRLANNDVEDDGINFYQMTPNNVVIDWEIINNAADQLAVLQNGGEPFLDVPAAIEALNAAYTQYHLNLKPLNKGPFLKTYDLGTLSTMVAKTYDA